MVFFKEEFTFGEKDYLHMVIINPTFVEVTKILFVKRIGFKLRYTLEPIYCDLSSI